MELTSFQKDIIREIVNRNVYDLLSFFSTFFKNKEYKHNHEYIKEKKKQDYENNKGNIEEYLKSIKKQIWFMILLHFLTNSFHQIIQQKKKKNSESKYLTMM